MVKWARVRISVSNFGNSALERKGWKYGSRLRAAASIGGASRALEAPPYNLVVHNAPFVDDVREVFHWHVEIIPRITRVAGFEWGTGFYINPTPPEEAAQVLRAIQL